MVDRSLEERVAALEAEVAQLKNRIVDQGVQKTGWQAMVGTFLNDPYYEKAMKYGRQYRESLRPKKKKKRRRDPEIPICVREMIGTNNRRVSL